MDYEQAEALGVSRQAFDEVLDIIGHEPSIDELSTLLAMWESNGKQQSLYGWLRGQHHAVQRENYLYTGTSDSHKSISEPRVRECVDIAHQLCLHQSAEGVALPQDSVLLYMVGNISSEFLGSDYARHCLHLSSDAVATTGSDEDCAYLAMIVEALQQASLLVDMGAVGQGGLFCSLLRRVVPLGFDILAPREVRLDAFLFGEETGRRLVAVEEKHDDAFLLKMDEARLNCCFLGRTTHNRVVVDGYDFGRVDQFIGVV